MKSLSDAGFFRTFDALIDAANPSLKQICWSFSGASWRRDRYSISGADYAFVVEAFTIHHERRPHWTLLVTKEHWWNEDRAESIRNARWSRAVAGQRADILSWFRKQEQLITEPGP